METNKIPSMLFNNVYANMLYVSLLKGSVDKDENDVMYFRSL